MDLGLIYPRKVDADKLFTIWTDASWCGDHDKRSTGGSLHFKGECLFHWKVSTCKSICLSSFESEMVFMSKACRIGIATVVLGEVFDDVALPITLFCDNQSAISSAINNKVTTRTKHIHINNMFVCKAVADRQFYPKYKCSKEMLADIMTKALLRINFEDHRVHLLR